MGKKRKKHIIKEEKIMDNNETENILIEENQNNNIEEQINNFVEPEEVVDKNTEPENNTDENNIKDNVILSGTVNGCDKLNIRKEPSMNAEIVDIINKGTIVNINKDLSTEEFYKINIHNDIKTIDGYCLKKFIILE